MKKAILLLLVGALGVAGYLYTKSQSAAAMILDDLLTVEGISKDAVTLDGCFLAIDVQVPSALGITRVHTYHDLSLYELHQITLIPERQKYVRYNARALPDNARAFEQVWQVMLEKPNDMDPLALPERTLLEGGGTRILRKPLDMPEEQSQLYTALKASTERGEVLTLTFGSQMSPETGAPIPHPDAPEFYDFAQRVLSLTDQTSLTVTMAFTGDTPTRGSFFSGSVIAPSPISLRFPSVEVAQAFAEKLARYQQSHCPTARR